MIIILAYFLLMISTLAFVQNRKPILERAAAFSDPWGPLICLFTEFFGLYILWSNYGIKSMVIGFLLAPFLGAILNIIFNKVINK